MTRFINLTTKKQHNFQSPDEKKKHDIKRPSTAVKKELPTYLKYGTSYKSKAMCVPMESVLKKGTLYQQVLSRSKLVSVSPPKQVVSKPIQEKKNKFFSQSESRKGSVATRPTSSLLATNSRLNVR